MTTAFDYARAGAKMVALAHDIVEPPPMRYDRPEPPEEAWPGDVWIRHERQHGSVWRIVWRRMTAERTWEEFKPGDLVD